MTNNIKIILIIIFGIIALYVFNLNSDHNLKKTILACMAAQKKTTKSYDIEKARKFCSEEIKKGIK